MNNKQLQTLKYIFENPVRSNILWVDIESMFIGLGAWISEGNGSRVRIKLNERRAVFHKPHPKKETNKGAIKSVRDFLINANIKKEDYLC